MLSLVAAAPTMSTAYLMAMPSQPRFYDIGLYAPRALRSPFFFDSPYGLRSPFGYGYAQPAYAPWHAHHRHVDPFSTALSRVSPLAGALERASELFDVLESATSLADVPSACRWHEVEGDKYETSLRLPGFKTSELSAEIEDERRLTIRGATSSATRKQEVSRTISLPFALKGPADIELVHAEADGLVTLRMEKPPAPQPSVPLKLPIVEAAAEPDKSEAEPVKVGGATSQAEQEAQLDEKFASVVADRTTDADTEGAPADADTNATVDEPAPQPAPTVPPVAEPAVA